MPGDAPATFVFDQDVQTFLAVCRTASLATVDRDGTPHNANVQFVPHGAGAAFDLWWVSSPDSAHSQHLLGQPAAAVTVYAHADEPEQIHGVQMRGVVDAALTPQDPGYAAARERYAARFAFVDTPPFDAAFARQGLYRFRTRWIRWIDNRRGFGWKSERTLNG